MAKSVVVDAMPVLAHEAITIDKSADQQQQGALWHVEVGDDGIDQTEGEARCDENLGGSNELLLMGNIEVMEYLCQRFGDAEGVWLIVRLPLMDDQVFGMHGAVVLDLRQLLANVVKTLKGADAGGAGGYE